MANIDLIVSNPLSDGFQYIQGEDGAGTSQLAISANGRKQVLIGETGVPQTGKLTVVNKALEDIGVVVTDGDKSNIVVQTLAAPHSGFQTINFNGWYESGREIASNTAKLRWRIGVDQRVENVDQLFIDVYNANTNELTSLLVLRLGEGKASLELIGDLKVTGSITAASVHVPA
ncbi:MAG TPA: hypothetical protein VFN10_00345 [Thermoanaerobaculia bacterium]|nr:hypothetical protein [Thermoanaerobaculia bacterium]